MKSSHWYHVKINGGYKVKCNLDLNLCGKFVLKLQERQFDWSKLYKLKDYFNFLALMVLCSMYLCILGCSMFSITNAASIKPQQKNIRSTVGKMLLLPLSCLWACWKVKRNQKVISLWGKKNKSGYYWSFSCLHVFDIYVWKGFQHKL